MSSPSKNLKEKYGVENCPCIGPKLNENSSRLADSPHRHQLRAHLEQPGNWPGAQVQNAETVTTFNSDFFSQRDFLSSETVCGGVPRLLANASWSSRRTVYQRLHALQKSETRTCLLEACLHHKLQHRLRLPTLASRQIFAPRLTVLDGASRLLDVEPFCGDLCCAAECCCYRRHGFFRDEMCRDDAFTASGTARFPSIHSHHQEADTNTNQTLPLKDKLINERCYVAEKTAHSSETEVPRTLWRNERLATTEWIVHPTPIAAPRLTMRALSHCCTTERHSTRETHAPRATAALVEQWLGDIVGRSRFEVRWVLLRETPVAYVSEPQ